MEKERNMTNEQLADLIRESHKETHAKIDELQQTISRLEEVQLSSEDKENLLVMVEHINERLENEALGKKDITLMRSEYDAIVLSKGFQNRFESLSEVGAE